MSDERDYLEEAFAIIDGTTLILPEREHLIVLHRFHQFCQDKEGRAGYALHHQDRQSASEVPTTEPASDPLGDESHGPSNFWH